MSHRCYYAENCADAESFITPAICDCTCHNGPYYKCIDDSGCGNRHDETVITLLGARIEAVRGLCPRCERRTVAGIRSLGADYDGLCALARSGVTASAGEVVAASRELPIPINLAADALAYQIYQEVTTVVEPLAERLNVDWDAMRCPGVVRRYRGAPAYSREVLFSKALALLSNALPVLLMLPVSTYALWRDGARVYVDMDGLAVAGALLALHRAARGMLGVTRYVQQLPMRCPRCRVSALTRPAGTSGVYCDYCHVSYTDEDYQEMTLVVADVWRDAVPAPAVRERPEAGADGAVARPLVIHAPAELLMPYTPPMVYQTRR